jgi:hypothetical protein
VQEFHKKGYIQTNIPLEREATKEEIESDKKREAEEAKEAAKSVISGKPKVRIANA